MTVHIREHRKVCKEILDQPNARLKYKDIKLDIYER